MLAEPSDRLNQAELKVAPRELGLMLKVSAALASTLELSQVLQTAIEGAVEVLDLDMGVVYLLDEGSLFLGAATPPLPPELPLEHRRARLEDHPHLNRCIDELEPLVIEDAAKQEMSAQEAEVVESANLVSCIFAPLAIEGRPLGAMIVHTVARPAMFDDEDVDLCRTLSHQISLAIANAKLFEEVQRSSLEMELAYDATLKGWSLALEMRDQDTMGHTGRVADMTVRLAVRMGLSDDQLVQVRRGALLHDIGKMVVPDQILLKPGPLSDAEWVIMRRHPDQARAMLEHIEYLQPAIEIPYCHHERWNGSGYPRGLIGENIPLAARIFAVVDVYDALTSHRPYRRAWTHEHALEHIGQQAGTEFDPTVVDAFIAEFGDIPN